MTSSQILAAQMTETEKSLKYAQYSRSYIHSLTVALNRFLIRHFRHFSISFRHFRTISMLILKLNGMYGCGRDLNSHQLSPRFIYAIQVNSISNRYKLVEI